MNRRNFLKALGIGAAVIAVPKLLVTPEDEEFQQVARRYWPGWGGPSRVTITPGEYGWQRFTTTLPPSGLWFDASQITNLVDGDQVALWAPVGGFGSPMIALPGREPIFVSNGVRFS